MAAARPCPHDLIRHPADATWKNPLHIRSASPVTRPGGPCYLKQACVRIITDLRMNSTDLCTHRKNGENKAHMAVHLFRHGRWCMAGQGCPAEPPLLGYLPEAEPPAGCAAPARMQRSPTPYRTNPIST